MGEPSTKCVFTGNLIVNIIIIIIQQIETLSKYGHDALYICHP